MTWGCGHANETFSLVSDAAALSAHQTACRCSPSCRESVSRPWLSPKCVQFRLLKGQFWWIWCRYLCKLCPMINPISLPGKFLGWWRNWSIWVGTNDGLGCTAFSDLSDSLTQLAWDRQSRPACDHPASQISFSGKKHPYLSLTAQTTQDQRTHRCRCVG